MESWHRLIGAIVKEAKHRGEIAADADPRELASIVTGSLEGGLMLTRITGDPAHLDRIVTHLVHYVGGLRRDRTAEANVP